MLSSITRPASASGALSSSSPHFLSHPYSSAPSGLDNYGQDHLSLASTCPVGQLASRKTSTPGELLLALMARYPADCEQQAPCEKLLERWRRHCFLSRDVPDPEQVPAVVALALELAPVPCIAEQLRQCEPAALSAFLFALGHMALELQAAEHCSHSKNVLATPVAAADGSSPDPHRYEGLKACLEKHLGHPVARHALALLEARTLAASGQWSPQAVGQIKLHCRAIAASRAPRTGLYLLGGVPCDAHAVARQVERELAPLPEALACFRQLP
jgi:hypothetical protein